MKGRAIRYLPEELRWLEERKEWPRRELHLAFQNRWRRHDITLINIASLCKRKGWLTGRDGRFDLGRAPANKGKPMPDEIREKCLKTAFKKGNLPHNARGAGHERVCGKDGYVVMIVDEVNPWTGAKTRPVHKHRYLWEQLHGPIPAGYALKCLDGDKTNTDPANWEAVPRGVLTRLNSRWSKLRIADAPEELKPTILASARLKQAIYEKKVERRQGPDRAKLKGGKEHG